MTTGQSKTPTFLPTDEPRRVVALRCQPRPTNSRFDDRCAAPGFGRRLNQPMPSQQSIPTFQQSVCFTVVAVTIGDWCEMEWCSYCVHFQRNHALRCL